MTLNITPKRKAILQRIHDAPERFNFTSFKGPERAAILLFFCNGLMQHAEDQFSYILTDKGRRALHAGEGWDGV